MTHTRTHVVVELADPFLACDQCKAVVTGWHDPQPCGCGDKPWNVPCEHNAGSTSTCPSWSPVDGCTCQEHLGYVPHPAAREWVGTVTVRQPARRITCRICKTTMRDHHQSGYCPDCWPRVS